MAYIIGLVVAVLFFVTLHYFTELKKHQKILVTAIVLSVIISAIGFNKYQNSKREQMLSAVLKFNQGSDISCDDILISNKDYTLSVGTYTFIGKEGTQNYSKMISASTCR